MRVYELARDLALESKEVLARAHELDIAVKTASSGLDEEAVALVRLSFEDETPAAPAEPETGVEEDGGPVAEPTAEELAGDGETDEPAPRDTADQDELVEGGAITVQAGITVQEFGRLFDKRTGEVVQQLMAMGEMIPGGGLVPPHALEDLGRAFGYDVVVEESDEIEVDEGPRRYVVEFEDDEATLQNRPPVITVMGHVDHGKTQLLDTIRHSNVVAGEAGGITQHIGAYQVAQNGSFMTFIDTPGHEAFTALRARGADLTDIAIIVVAADDGVMPQTVEAINHAKAAEVPIIVAINKMDLPTADPFAVRAALTEHDVVVEQLGGEVVSAEVSALEGTGIDDLLELIALVAEVEDFQANPSAPAVGTVVEAQLEVGRGPVGTIIVQRGTLKRGDAIVAGSVSGRVRAMFDENGNKVSSAGPSTPVLMMGWSELPTAGDMFQVVENDREARKLAEHHLDTIRRADLTIPTAGERLGQLLEHFRTTEHAELRLVIKADAHGSLEAIRESVGKITREGGEITVIHGAIGGITANDVALADASEAVIYGFNVRPDANARRAAADAGIEMRIFSIIYELLEDVEALLVGELAPEEIETFLGVAEVRALYRNPRLGTVAGCYVSEGEINRNARARLVREGVVVYDGRIISLRRFKDDVATVASGIECGIGLESFRDIKEGDTIESYEVREVART